MSHTILIADDSATIRRAVEIAFAKEPYAIVNAKSGDEAIQRARETKPALVLADHAMPGKTGYEVAEALKRDPSTSHIPVVLLTNNGTPLDEARAQAAGVAGHVAKPFECEKLVDRIAGMLGGGRAQLHVAAVRPLMPAGTGAPSSAPIAVAASAAPKPAAPAAPKADPFGFSVPPTTSTGTSASAAPANGGLDDITFELALDEKKPAAPAAPLAATAPKPTPVAPSAPPAAVKPAIAPTVAPMSHAPLAAAVAHQAAPAVALALGENGAPSSAAISAAAREIIERVVWEVVPELAETLIREEIQRLLRERTK